MKPKKYISKFNLDENDKFDHSAFVEDLKEDFLALVEIRRKGGLEFISQGSFSVAVKDIRCKYDAIIRSSSYDRPEVVWERLWKFFFATVICPARDEALGVKEFNKELSV